MVYSEFGFNLCVEDQTPRRIAGGSCGQRSTQTSSLRSSPLGCVFIVRCQKLFRISSSGAANPSNA